jgi:hypothetical protein
MKTTTLSIVKELIEEIYAKINERDDGADTSLTFARQHDVASYLVSHGGLMS